MVSETEDRENKLDREVGRTKYGNFGLEKFRLLQQGEEIKSSKFIHREIMLGKKDGSRSTGNQQTASKKVIILHTHTR